jgi:hypothetical protein
MVSKEDYFDSIPKAISFFSLLYLFGSLWFVGLHYSFFGINIFSYISFTDSINMFINKLPLMTILSIGAIIFFYLFQIAFEKVLKKVIVLSDDDVKVKRTKFFKSLIVMAIISLLPMLLFMVFIPTWIHGAFKEEWFVYVRALIGLFNIYWYVYLSFSISKSKYDRNKISKYPMFLTIILTYFAIIYYYHRIEILRISEKDYRNEITQPEYVIKMKNDEVIKTADSCYFLGKTKDYIFLVYPGFGGSYSRTQVINMSDVEEFNTYKIIPWYSVFP